MIPTKKNIAILHPWVNVLWWAVKMMIRLWHFLQEKWNNVVFYTFDYNRSNFKWNIDLPIIEWTIISIAHKISKADYVFIWNSPMQFVWILSKIVFRSSAKMFWRHHHYPWYYWKNTGFKNFLKKYLEKRAIKKIDVLIANSKYTQDIIYNIFSLESNILYPLVDDIFSHETHYVDPSNKSNAIISYGRWVDWKNIADIFYVYDTLKNIVPDLTLFIWWIWKELEKYKERYIFDKSVSFLGFLDKKQIVYYLQNSKVFLFPPSVDSFWLSALESMFIWTPVVWYNNIWVSEIIQNNKNWYLVDSKSELLEKTKILLTDMSILKKMSKNTVFTKSKFSSNLFNEQLENIFLKIK